MSKQCTLATNQARIHVQDRVRILRSHIPLARAQDPEGIHQLRVASRRLRAALSEHRPAFKREPLQRLQVIARDVTQGLGRTRELDVMLGLLKVHREPLKSVARLAVNELLQCLRLLRDESAPHVLAAAARAASPELDEALLAAFGALHPPRECYLKHVRSRLLKRWEELCGLFDSWQVDQQEELLHDLRKAAKKFRYSCELSVDLYPDALEEFMRGLKAVQQDLGNWNDYRLLREEVRRCVPNISRRGTAGLAEVLALLQGEMNTYRGHFESHAAQFFPQDHRSAVRSILEAPLESCCR